jgi:hypothetical protein
VVPRQSVLHEPVSDELVPCEPRRAIVTDGIAGGRPVVRKPSVVARHPALPSVGVAMIAWGVLAVLSPAAAWLAVPGTYRQIGSEPAGHGAHGGLLTPAGLAMLTVMTAAMMAPLSTAGARRAATTGPVWWAGRACGWFLAAVLLTWTVIAVGLSSVAEMLGGVLGSPAIAAGGLILCCAIAELDPRRVARITAGDAPVRLTGNGSAGVDCARCGVLAAWRGVPVCGLPMLAMLAVPGSLLVMAILTALAAIDHLTRGRLRLLFALLYAVLGTALLL